MMKRQKNYYAALNCRFGISEGKSEKNMAKKCSVERDKKRRKLNKSLGEKRDALKAIIKNKETSMEERFAAVLKLAEMPRNSAKNRIRNRCALTGRPRSHYRKFRISRVALRELASRGELPGVTKSSW